MRVTFRLVRIGEIFQLNGSTYIKKSTKTATVVGIDKNGMYCTTSSWFYVGQMENCKI
jgi:hypothetical protein